MKFLSGPSRVTKAIRDSVNQAYFEKNKDSYSILDFKNKYYGQECFIVGNGPSLLPEDLDAIKQRNIVTFASNKIYKIFNNTDWRPTYVTVSDDQFIYDSQTLHNIINIKPEMFFTRSQFAKTLKNINGNICFLNSDISRQLLKEPQFSLECNKIIYDIATVTYFSLQIAAYMGFKRMYLIGMDNLYAYSKLRDGTIVRNEGVANYFGEQGIAVPDPSNAVSTWELDIAYEYADRFSREHNFRIFNATRGGFLEKFERVSLDEVLSQK